MEKMNDLKALLQHEVQDLVSAEDQIIAALPQMIEKAQNTELKKALEQHLSVTQKQRERLNAVQDVLKGNESEDGAEENKSIFSGLMNVLGGGHTCKGMEGIITEGQKIMKEDMSPEVMDAAIIACAQKVEHYEICGYGTARAYAMQLNLDEATRLLQETLGEEYEADDRLTQLALTDVNEKADTTDDVKKAGAKTAAKKAPAKAAAKSEKAAPKKAAAKKEAPKKETPKKAAAKKTAAKKAAPEAKAAPKKAAAKKAGKK